MFRRARSRWWCGGLACSVSGATAILLGMTDRRLPLFMTADEVDALHEGVPAWLRAPMISWITDRAGRVAEQLGDYEYAGRLLRGFDMFVRNTNPLAPNLSKQPLSTILSGVSEERLLQLIDYALRGDSSISATPLGEALQSGGSAWKVYDRDGYRGLERRVPEGVQAAADAVMTGGTRAGERLATAWHEAFGMSPDPSKAYAEAVKAVEDAAIPVVCEGRVRVTMSDVIRTMRADGDWSLPLSREDAAAPSSETVLRMCQGLWKGHHDRHGGDPNAPAQVSQAEAEAALFLAVPLVQWFSSGAVARR